MYFSDDDSLRGSPVFTLVLLFVLIARAEKVSILYGVKEYWSSVEFIAQNCNALKKAFVNVT